MTSQNRLKRLGMDLMIRWNEARAASPSSSFEMAVMGHIDEDDGAYKFIIGRAGKEYEIAVREIE